MNRLVGFCILIGATLAVGCQQDPVVVHASAATQPSQQAQTVSFFYDELVPYGRWVDVPQYGRCWYPTGVTPSWRPYTNGQWIYTDDSNWLWAGKERWSWAVDHYGRWMFTDALGWVWVPGRAWSPAWVAWRSGNGVVGSAPLAPVLGADDGDLTRIDSKHIRTFAYSFVPEKELVTPNISTRFLPLTTNITLLDKTQDATKYDTLNGNRIFSHGLPVDQIEDAMAKPVRRHHIIDRENSGGSVVRGDDISIYRPLVIDRGAEPRLASAWQRDDSPDRIADEREQLDRYFRVLRGAMQERHDVELASLGPKDLRDGIEARQTRETKALDDERAAEVEALRRRQRDEREASAAARQASDALAKDGKFHGGFAPLQKYELPPEWQMPPEMMNPQSKPKKP